MTDYSLTGPSSVAAVERGLANAEWFAPVIDPERLRELQRRSNTRAAVDVALWLALIVASGVWAYSTIWSWWSIPAFMVFGALYGGAADARWHECGHGTAFRSPLANDVIYHLASFMLWRGPTVWRWSHYRHHTDTIIVGRDAEIVFQRPPSVGRAVFAFTHLQGGPQMFARLVRHAAGRLDDDAKNFVPETEHRRVVWESRIMVAIVGAVAVWSLVAWTIVPLMFIGLPTIYGGWLVVFFGITQHAGMRENVLDHRYSTRSVAMNPVFRFLYLNMNYHVEHHLLPSVPYRALPDLHDEISDQLAPRKPNTLAAYREIFHALRRQSTDPTWEIPLDVPDVPSATRQRIDVGETNWVRHADGGLDIGAADTLEAGQLRRVDIDDRTFVVCRLADGQLSLADGLCTHAEVHLADGAIVDGQIECPKHNGRVDAVTGEPTRKPIRTALCVYDVDEIAGRIVTHLTVRSNTHV
ncbi:MAG: fatty acid desaturase [Ilumatobacteraceae bacterium]|nr:fatty acid desaturase [Ilumatobacteraceae bacterium]